MIKKSLCHKRRTHLVKHIAIMTTLIMGFSLFSNTFINNYFKSTITANAEDTTWVVVNYSTMTDANLSAADIALMHDNNWLNQYVATKRSKTLATLTLTDFLSITSLTRNNCSLTTLPDSIKFMVNLAVLNIENNKLTSLPNDIGNLIKLWHFDFLGNGITSLPDSIGNLTGLTYMDCSNNKLTSLPNSIGNLTILGNLYLMNNQIKDLPDNIIKLTKLRELYCVGNNLTTLPSNIGNLTGLQILNCMGNNLTNIPESIGNLTNLTDLDFSYNQLTSLPDSIVNLIKLTSLYCTNNFLTLAPANPVNLVNRDYSSNFINLETSQNQLSFVPNNTVTVVIGDKLNISEIIATSYDNGLGTSTMSQSVIDKLQLITNDSTIISNTGETLKTGTTTIRVQLPNNSIDNMYGITQIDLKVIILPLSTNQDVSITFTQSDSLELTLSTNTVDFGDVTGIQTTSVNTAPAELIATVKSSLPYDLDVKATDNFTNITDTTASQIPITKLGIKVNNGAITKFDGINISKSLANNESATSEEATVSKSYTINFTLDQTIGYKAGNYEAPLTITATQK